MLEPLGNHESITMNQMYGFEGEVKAKYSSQMAEFFTEVYNQLPLAHCINQKVLVRHELTLVVDVVLLVVLIHLSFIIEEI